MVAFPILGDPQNAAFVAWTTTPWTLPSNLALCVNANFVYVKVRWCKFILSYFFGGISELIINLILSSLYPNLALLLFILDF